MEPKLKAKSIALRSEQQKLMCLDLPKTTDIVRYLDMEPNTMNIYKHLARDSFSELSRGKVTATNILTKILRLSQLTGGFLGDDEGKEIHQISTAKLNALEDIVDEVTSSGKKLVVIARFIPEIEAITDLLSKKKLKFSIITGNVKNRSEQIEQF